MLKIGITGGIGSGKSTVAALFARFDIPIIDTDTLSHEVLADAAIVAQLKTTFGEAIFTPDLDKRALRNLIFKDPVARTTLESITHPAVLARLQQKLQQYSAPYVLILIPLLVEKNLLSLVDRILVIDTPRASQIARTRARDNVSHAHMQQILKSQVSRQARRRIATEIICNDRDLSHLEQEVTKLHAHYLTLSHPRASSPSS